MQKVESTAKICPPCYLCEYLNCDRLVVLKEFGAIQILKRVTFVNTYSILCIACGICL